MSDVEQQVERWRADLGGSELLRQSDVDELENHLREEMAHWETRGLSDEEAFLVARQRLGDPATLEEEFAKVHPGRRVSNRLYWMILGVLSYCVLAPLLGFLSLTLAHLGYRMGLQGALLSCLTWAASMGVFAGAVYLLLRYLACRWHSHIMARGIVAPIGLSALALCTSLLMRWSAGVAHDHLLHQIAPSEVNQLADALGGPLGLAPSIVWYAGIVLLSGGALAIFSRRSKTPSEIQQ